MGWRVLCVVALVAALPACAQADTGAWAPAAPMGTARTLPAAATLSDGRVLVVGGLDANGRSLTSAEIYDPTTNTWSPTAPLPAPRYEAAAAALPGDRVLVTGGRAGDSNVSGAEIYSAATNRWSEAASPLGSTSTSVAAAPLPGGRVLVVGGDTYAQIYDPTTNTWQWATTMGEGEYFAGGLAAASLPDGEVYVTSTNGPSNLNPQIYDPTTSTWSYTDSVPPLFSYNNGNVSFTDISSSSSVASLGDGHLLIVGGYGDQTTMKLFDSSNGEWSEAASLPAAPLDGVAAPLAGGRVLVVGGSGAPPATTSAEIFTGPAAYPSELGTSELQINGDPAVGSTLSATGGAGDFTYQWERCNPTCTPLGPVSAPTADPSRYTVTPSDAGATLTVQVTGTDGYTATTGTARISWPVVQLGGSPVRVFGPSVIEVSRTDSTNAASVHYELTADPVPGSTVPPASGELRFAPGQAFAGIPLTTEDHGAPIFERSYALSLSAPEGVFLGNPSHAQVLVCFAPQGCGNGTPRDPLNPLALPIAPRRSNPLAGASFFVDRTGTAAAHAVATLSVGDPADAALLGQIVDQPDVTRFGTWDGNYPGRAVSQFLDRVQAQEPGTIPMLATYKLVDSHVTHPYCGRWADPPVTQAEYHEWITNLAEGIDYRPAVLFLEMDSLITVGCLSKQGLAIRLNELHDAINVLSNVPHLVVYLDAGAADAVKAKKVASLLKRAGIAQIQGFFLNSTHFDWTKKEIRYGEQISKLTGGKHFVINTAENGRGPLVPRNRARYGNEVLCNPPGRGLGPLPTTTTGYKHLDAFAWIANPGVSGGVCGPGEPPGGVFSTVLARSLVQHADFAVR